jgi:hypothetical protein
MTSSNLVPTPIVNKNGVRTTVYKAAGGPSSSPVGNLPAPAVSGIVSVTKLASSGIMDGLALTFDDPFTTVPSEISKSRIQRTLEGYPEDTQEYIREVQTNHPEDSYFDRMLISMLHKRDSPETIEDVLYAFDNLPDSWDTFTYTSDWTDDGFDVDYELIRTVNGAKSYGFEICAYGTEDKPLRHYDEITRKQALALIALCSEMSMDETLRTGLGSDDTSSYIEDKSTVRHAARTPEMVDDMLQDMLTHGRTDWDVIEAMRNAPSVPLREGTL